MYDLVIRDGLIVDGTGRAGFHGDVAVEGGRIVSVGSSAGPARRDIAAEGRLVTPGFVDVHTHYDGQVSWDPELAPSSVNGVTSVVMGNCGVGFAPVRPDKHDFLIRLLEGVEDIPGTALSEGIKWDWEGFPEYLDAIAAGQFAVDVGAQVPHAALRAYVMGDRGADHLEHPSEEEIARMAQLTYEALEAGAIGFSTSRTHVHRSRDGRNIGTLNAGDRELLGIAEAVARSGKGVMQLISDAYMTPDDAFAAAEVALVWRLAEVSGRPLAMTVLQADEAPDRWRHLLREIAGMAAAGLTVKAQVAPRPGGVILAFGSTTNPFVATPTWQRLAAASWLDRLQALRTPEVKAQVLSEQARVRLPGLAGQLCTDFGRMFRMDDPVDYEPQADTSLAAQAERAGRQPAEFTYDVLLEADGRRLIYMPLINYAHGNLDDVFEMMTSEQALFGLSDGGAHCGSICDASYPTTTLALWSRGSKSGHKIPLEQLVHGYTQRNAAHVGWRDRGVLDTGYLADLNLIDLDALSLGPPRIVADLPAGGARLLQEPRGYAATVKSGVVTFEDGAWTGETPGKLVRGAQERRRPH